MIPAYDMDFGACIANKDDMWAGKSGSPEQICAQSVASMECKSFADAWTEAMVADSLAQSYNHLWLAEDQAGNACGYLLANILGDETELLLRQAVASLPEKQRVVFNLKYFEEMKYEDMSALLGTSVGALKASYHLAVKKIEQFFNEID